MLGRQTLCMQRAVSFAVTTRGIPGEWLGGLQRGAKGCYNPLGTPICAYVKEVCVDSTHHSPRKIRGPGTPGLSGRRWFM